MKFYYWRRAHNTDTLHIVFANRDNRNGIRAFVKPADDGMWFYRVKKPFSVTEATEATQEEAQAKAEQLIDREFQPEYIPHFG
jgi:hypothetical protein